MWIVVFDYTHLFTFLYTPAHVFIPAEKWDPIYIELDVSRDKS